MMLGRLLLLLKKRWYLSVSAVMILTFILSFPLSEVDFHFKLTSFIPDSDTVEAKERMDSYFSIDANVHYLLFTETNSDDDVLSPRSLRDAYDILSEIERIPGVTDIQSVPEIYDNALHYLNGTGLLNSSDSDIRNLTIIFTTLLNDENASQLLPLITGVNEQVSERILEEMKLSRDIFLSKDFRKDNKASSMIALVFLDPDMCEAERKVTVSEIGSRSRSMLDETGSSVPFEIKHTGEDLALLQIDGEVESAKYILSGFAILFISTVLYFSFRRASRVLLPMVTLAIALAWTFGIGSLLGLENSPLDLAVFPLVVGIGVDFSIHLLKRYDENFLLSGEEETQDQNSIFTLSWRQVSKPLFIAAMTTIIAFMANIFSNVESVFNFGILCSLGIAFSLLLNFIFLFPLSVSIDEYLIRNDPGRFDRILRRGLQTPHFIGRNIKKISRYVTRFPVLVLIVVILITTFGVISGIKVEKEFSMDDFVTDSLPARGVEKTIESDFNASSMSRLYYLYEGDGSPGPAVLFDIAEKMLYIEKAPFVVRIDGRPRAESIMNVFQTAMKMNSSLIKKHNFDHTDLLPLENCTAGDINGLIAYLSINDTISSPFDNATFSDELGKLFVYDNGSGKYAAIITIYVNSRTGEESKALVAQLERGMETSSDLSEKVSLTGWTVIVVEMVDSMERSQVYATVMSFIMALLILLFLYRSIRYSIIGMLPVLISTAWILGFMYVLSIPLNILTITVTALSIGIGVDYSVHMIERFREERLRFDREKAIKRTLKYTGTSIFISAFTTISGFLILLASPLPISRTFGVITGLSVFFAFVLSCVLVPVLLLKSIRRNV